MILEGKTYKAVKQGNTGINYIPDNSDPSFIFGQGVIGAYDWEGYIPYSQGWAVPDDNNPSSSIEFQPYTVISGTYVFSFYVRMNSGGVPIVEYPIAGRDLNVNVFGNTTVYKEHIGDNIYRVWSYNTIATSAGSSVGVGKNTINTNNGFVAWGFQLEPGTVPSVPTPTTGTAITTVPEIKLKPILGNGIVYKPISLLAETDAVLSRAEYEGYDLPNDNGIIALDYNIRERINEGIWQETDYGLVLAHNNTMLNNFGLINLKNPWSITNLVTQSSNWADSSWGGNTKIPNSPGTLAPDGSQTACYITNVGRTTLTRKTGIIANSTTITYSIYAKSGTDAGGTFLLRNETTSTNFTNGVIIYGTGVITGSGWTAINVGNGWFRLSYTQTTGIAIGDELSIYYGRTNSTGAPSTADWYVWGAQVEDRDKASKYVSTGSNPIYGNGLATAHGGVSYTVNGFDTGGVDGYLNLHYNPSKTSINYQANRGGVGVVLYNSGGYPITQDNATNSTTMLTPSNSAVQRINNVADLGAAIDLSGDGSKYLQRTGVSSGEYTNNGLDGSVTFANLGVITDRFFNVGRARISSAYAYSQTRISMLHVFGNLTAAQRQKSRDIDNKYLQRIGLTPIA